MKSERGSCDEIPVFIDTNIGTHLALSIPPDIKAGDLKRRLEKEHLSCFGNLGEIVVHTLMVKRRSYFYHLPDSLPIKSAFHGIRRTWFLQMNASMLQNIESDESPLKRTQNHKDQMIQSSEEEPSTLSNSDITQCSQLENLITFKDKSRVSVVNGEQPETHPVPMDNGNANHLLSGHQLESRDAPSMNISKEISVTGIISRYFSDSDGVTSCRKKHKQKFEETHMNDIASLIRASNFLVDQVSTKRLVESDTDSLCSVNNVIISDMKQFKAASSVVRKRTRRCRRMSQFRYSEKAQVGKKLIQAANNISISGSWRKLSRPTFMERCGNLLAHESGGLVRNLAFEIDVLDD
ncbi:uncharacterized protein A4U43_C05F14010 [Asparagus officinalis]|uniref:Uncharacterized protein n=1 Tax=Asparagus officinalis TaxID=4686 RepID=A0A5P1EU24_ASPOF|nr:uncharacterized protein LOC109843526 [Asparagus officinalis]ONK68617.1 uncharacterized protein A4U43_C05F14010 [Asparagus officinalis]